MVSGRYLDHIAVLAWEVQPWYPSKKEVEPVTKMLSGLI